MTDLSLLSSDEIYKIYQRKLSEEAGKVMSALQAPPAREECERCKDWQKQGLSDTCPSCDAPPPQPVDDREAYSTPEIVSQIALHADMIDELVRRPPTREFYEKLHKSDEILSGLDQRRILLDYIAELQAARSAEGDVVSVPRETWEKVMKAGDDMREELTNYWGGSRVECAWLKLIGEIKAAEGES